MIGSVSVALRVGGALAAGAVVIAAAGCSSSSSSSAPPAAQSATTPAASSAPASAPAPASSAPSSASSPHAVSTPTGGASSTGGGGTTTAACTTQDLQVKVGTGEGAAGSVYQVIDFTNSGSAPCTLYGYPGVSLGSGSPVTQVGAAATRSNTSAAAVVTLAPGATGNALLRVTQAMNYPSATCSPKATTYLHIFPPNQTAAVDVAYKSTGCGKEAVKLLTIGAVQPGANSSQ
jgi:Protein of unknown function (DUF4232)